MHTLTSVDLEFYVEKMLQTGTRLSYEILEKDYWVVWLLELLFSGPYANVLTFKGGTSLSKAYGVVSRFSEDVDVTIDRGLVAVDPNKSLEEPGLGRAQRTKRTKAFDDSAAAFVTGTFAPWLNKEIQKHLADRVGGTEPQLRSDENDPMNLLFDYPRRPDAPEDTYIKPFVRLEIGARGDRSPQIRKAVKSYLEEAFPAIFLGKNQISLNVLALERTFWEKATILHSVCCRPEDKPPRDRFSRHYYDLYHLASDAELMKRALPDKDLLAIIVENKRAYFHESWDWYPTARHGTFRLVPSAQRQKELGEDYEAMRGMIFGETPEFEDMMGALKDLEERINRI